MNVYHKVVVICICNYSIILNTEIMTEMYVCMYAYNIKLKYLQPFTILFYVIMKRKISMRNISDLLALRVCHCLSSNY